MALPSWSSLRRGAAALSSLAIVWVLVDMTHPGYMSAKDWIMASTVLAVPLVAAGAILVPRVAAQLLARGLWWSLLLFDTLLVAISPAASGPPRYVACFAAGALLSAGHQGLEAGTGRFQPVAFRGTLMLALVLAMADVAVFLAGGLGMAIDTGRITMLLLVAPMVASVVGLLRLRTWGLLVGLVTNVVVATLALTRVLNFPNELRLLFIASAGLQLLIPLPMLITILRRRVPPPDRWQRAKRLAATGVILAMAAISIYCGFIREPKGYLYW
jgi:hypothetical protein